MFDISTDEVAVECLKMLEDSDIAEIVTQQKEILEEITYHTAK